MDNKILKLKTLFWRCERTKLIVESEKDIWYVFERVLFENKYDIFYVALVDCDIIMIMFASKEVFKPQWCYCPSDRMNKYFTCVEPIGHLIIKDVDRFGEKLNYHGDNELIITF